LARRSAFLGAFVCALALASFYLLGKKHFPPPTNKTATNIKKHRVVAAQRQRHVPFNHRRGQRERVLAVLGAGRGVCARIGGVHGARRPAISCYFVCSYARSFHSIVCMLTDIFLPPFSYPLP
jgi:hypothetical protein